MCVCVYTHARRTRVGQKKTHRSEFCPCENPVQVLRLGCGKPLSSLEHLVIPKNCLKFICVGRFRFQDNLQETVLSF